MRMFEDYKLQVVLTYREKMKEGNLSINLMNPSPGKLRDECLIVYKERHSPKDEKILRSFFGSRYNAIDYSQNISKLEIDKFRPLINFIKGKTIDPDERIVELLAWLIDFEQRPYGIANMIKTAHENSIDNSRAEFEKQKNIIQSARLVSEISESETSDSEYAKSLPLSSMQKTKYFEAKNKGNDDVFISYSWDSLEHEERIIDFTNHLRENGFPAVIDKMLTQEETAINFVKMMYKAINDYSKVIVVLSNGYKQKADQFKGGVGREYEILINDITDNPNKYILVSFQGRGDDIIPVGLKGRDIIDLRGASEETRLFEKLLGHKRYVFSEVATKKVQLSTRQVQKFIFSEDNNDGTIEPMV